MRRLPEATTVHWHGLEVPIGMDGVPAISQPLVYPGGRFTYEFDLRQNGTFFYHSHMPMQEMIGMLGFFVIHPKTPYTPHCHRDFGLVLPEWAIVPHNTVPNTLSMAFNWLTLNGRAGPATTPLLVKVGERMRIRMINLGMDHHPIHLHGHQFEVTGTESGRVPESARYRQNTVIVGVAQARDIEFDAAYPGDWMFHCHLPHHMMNQMVSMAGPLARGGHGMQAGGGMEEGMGMAKMGHALAQERGPALGRGTGILAREKETSHLAGPNAGGAHTGHGGGARGAAAPFQVPGYPQDMWMPMDEAVAKPENDGLAPGWSGAVMGMMNLVRVLPGDRYETIMAMAREGAGKPQEKGKIFEHKH